MFYQRWGFQLSESWASGSRPSLPPIWPGKGLWPATIAVFHYAFGPVSVSLIVFNSLCVALETIALQKSTALLTGLHPRWSITLIMLSSSPFLFFGPSMLREAIFWLGTSLGVLSIAHFHRRNYLYGPTTLFFSLTLLLGIRPDLGLAFSYAIVSVLVFIILLRRGRWAKLRATGSAVLVLALLSTAPGVFAQTSPITAREGDAVGGWRDNLSSQDVETVTSPLTLPDNELIRSFCQSGFAPGLFCGSILSLPSAFLGPFWWELGSSPVWVLIGTSSLHFLLLWTLSIHNLLPRRRRSVATISLCFLSFSTLLIFSAIMTNYGVLVRFRAASEIFLIPLGTAALINVGGWIADRRRPTSKALNLQNL